MRFRDLFIIAAVSVVTLAMGLHGRTAVQKAFYDSRAINREDARSVAATLLSADDWVEFHILSDATTVRLLSNAALQSVDAPDHDLTNPRLGWRYTIEYELLDSAGNIVDAADYHFRTQVRQLEDVETGEAIYPIFFGKSGLVSAQTRPMQLAVDSFQNRPSILRVRLKSADPGIVEVVGRSLSRIQRPDFNKRYTWNRMSKMRRDLICKYTVYQPELLTFAERTNLLRWRWAQTPSLTESQKRSLYFIGAFDDQEIRDEQLPSGLYTDANWLATIPVPEGPGKVWLHFSAIDQAAESAPQVTVRWFGIGATERRTQLHRLSHPETSMACDVSGGLIEIQSPVRLVTRAFWRPGSVLGNQAEHAAASPGLGEEIEITPAPILSKAFVTDQQSVHYQIAHADNQATPLRLTLRYPFGPHFTNVQIQSTDDPVANTIGDVAAIWEFLDDRGSVIATGDLKFTPVVSRYDNLELLAGTEWLSEPQQYYFSVPPEVATFRVASPDAVCWQQSRFVRLA